MANQRPIGLKDIHIALITSDSDGVETVYAAPIKIAGAIAAKITKNTNEEVLYSDDSVEDTLTNFDSIDIEVEVSALDMASRAKIQGSKYVKGALAESKGDIPPDLALGFRAKKGNGKYRYVWLLKGKFKPVDDEYATSEDKAKPQTAKLKGKFVSRLFDGNHQLIADEDSVGIEAGLIAGWFTAVPDVPGAI
jgi:phi13 family phage major tail protein